VTVNIYYHKNFQLKCIWNPNIEKMIKCLCLLPGHGEELIVFYEDEFLIFDINEERLTSKIIHPTIPVYLEFNSANQLMIVNKTGKLEFFDSNTRKLNNILVNEGHFLQMAKWNPFVSHEFVFVSNDSLLFLGSISFSKTKKVNLKLEEGLSINDISWYICDENYKYLLVSVSDGNMFLTDMEQEIIIQRYEKYGSASK